MHILRILRALTASAAIAGFGICSNNAAVDPLGSQNSLVYDAALDMLFALNVGDNTVTAFQTGFAGVRLHRTARAPSGGLIPVSVDPCQRTTRNRDRNARAALVN
jgi:hypothetical protein